MGSQANEPPSGRWTRAILWPMPTWVEARSVADRQPEDCRREVRLIRKSPSRKNYRLTYQVRVPHGSIPVFMIKAFEAATKDKLCCLPGLRLRLREETACSQTVSMALIPGVQAELA